MSGPDPVRLMTYRNVPKTIGSVLSSGKASMYELGAHLGLEDMWDLLEVISVDAHNQRILNTPKD